jgi:hypothetical protein
MANTCEIEIWAHGDPLISHDFGRSIRFFGREYPRSFKNKIEQINKMKE